MRSTCDGRLSRSNHALSLVNQVLKLNHPSLECYRRGAQVDLKNQSGNPKDKFCGDNVPNKPDRVCPGLL